MRKLLTIMFVMMLAAGAQAVILTNDNFDAHSELDDYITVNTWGWTAFSTLPHPYVRASWNVSAPNGLGDDLWQNFAMQKVLGSPVTGADLTMSFYSKLRNGYWSPINIQIGENGAQDRLYFNVGGFGSWTFKYKGLNGATVDILDFGGNPLEVGWSGAGGERFLKTVITVPWVGGGAGYGSTYDVQIFEVDGTPLCPVNTCTILDQDFQDNGQIDDIDFILVNANGNNHPRWIDDLYIEVIPEPATMSLVGLALLALYRRK